MRNMITFKVCCEKINNTYFKKSTFINEPTDALERQISKPLWHSEGPPQSYFIAHYQI